MDRPFDLPLRLSNGTTIVVIASISEAGAFLLQHYPPRRRRRESYRTAVQACVRALAGRVEPEVARQALLLALEDLNGKIPPVKTRAGSGDLERISEPEYLRRSII